MAAVYHVPEAVRAAGVGRVPWCLPRPQCSKQTDAMLIGAQFRSRMDADGDAGRDGRGVAENELPSASRTIPGASLAVHVREFFPETPERVARNIHYVSNPLLSIHLLMRLKRSAYPCHCQVTVGPPLTRLSFTRCTCSAQQCNHFPSN
jgi:hypothetical protein